MGAYARFELAQNMAGPVLSQLSPNQSAQEQKRIILDQPDYYVPALGYGGPAFDLKVLLGDPAFCLPGKSRPETERIIAECTQETIAQQMDYRDKEDSRDHLAAVLRVYIGAAAIFGVAFALLNVSHIVDFIRSWIGN